VIAGRAAAAAAAASTATAAATFVISISARLRSAVTRAARRTIRPSELGVRRHGAVGCDGNIPRKLPEGHVLALRINQPQLACSLERHTPMRLAGTFGKLAFEESMPADIVHRLRSAGKASVSISQVCQAVRPLHFPWALPGMLAPALTHVHAAALQGSWSRCTIGRRWLRCNGSR
jgi:hypothetical protein